MKMDEIVPEDIGHDEEIDSKKKNNAKKEILQWVQSLIVSVIVVALIVTFVGRPLNVEGISMLPTFSENDKIITTNLHGDLKRGDVVVIKRERDVPLIKRIIAVENDIIDINFETGEVSINGEILDEPYINEPTNTNRGMQFPATVPEGHVFVMGDNRNHSDDSRNSKIGMINTRNIFGKVIFRIFPFDKFGTIK